MIVGIRALAEYAGVSSSTAMRDLEAELLKPTGIVRSGRGLPTYSFDQADALAYRQYRLSLFQSPKGIRHRAKLKPDLDLQAALDKAYEQGYNAGRRASQREEKVYRVEGP